MSSSLGLIRRVQAMRRDAAKKTQTRPRVDARVSLLDFVPQTTPRWSRPGHLAPIADLLERAARGEAVRAVVSVPPRHGKTELLLHAIPWWLRRYPEQTVGYASYAAEFAHSKSRLARDYALAAGVTLRGDSSAVHEWRTPQNGGCLATGVGGPLTGHGLNLLLVDDPHKNRAEAESFTIREAIHQWFTSTAMTRLEPNGSAIVVHTRWHPDDLIGRLEQDPEVPWEVVNLPALAEGGERDRAPGEALWPERWSAAALQKRCKDVGHYDWASMFQGRPRPRGGSVFGDAQLYTALPAHYRIAIGVDLAYSEKKTSDWSVAIVLAESEGLYYVLDVVRLQVAAPAFLARLELLHERYPTAPIVGYVAGTERGTTSFFEEDLPFTPYAASADKFVRAIPVSAAWNAGKVLVPDSAPEWTRAFLSELAIFTGVRDKHDDQVDAIAAAFDELHEPSEQSSGLDDSYTRIGSHRRY